MHPTSRTIPPTWRHDAPHFYTTDQAAAVLGVRPHTLRAALCRDGGYLGIRPVKRANRLLAWPADQVDRVAAGEAAV